MRGIALFVLSLFAGCSCEPPPPTVSLARTWDEPVGERWAPGDPVSASAVSVEMAADQRALELWEAVRGASRAGAERIELIGLDQGRPVGLPLELPSQCPTEVDPEHLCNTACLTVRANEAELAFLGARQKRGGAEHDCTASAVQFPKGRIYEVLRDFDLRELGLDTFDRFELPPQVRCDYAGLVVHPAVTVQRLVEAYEALISTGARRVVLTVLPDSAPGDY